MSRLRAQSARRRKEQAVRRGYAAELGDDTPCSLRVFNVCTGRAEAFHELVGAKQGGSRIDRSNLAPACHRCNVWVEDNPELARGRDLKVPAYQAVPGDHGLVPAIPNRHAIRYHTT